MSRKEKILKEALKLFSEQGFSATSTKVIAEKAKVSEALIFKHFGKKDALLSYIIRAGYRRILMNHKGMLTYNGPRDFLLKMIYLPNKLVSDEPLFGNSKNDYPITLLLEVSTNNSSSPCNLSYYALSKS